MIVSARNACCFALLIIIVLVAACGETKKVEKPPKLDLQAINHANLTLDRIKGHWVFIDFWASWCAPCIDAFPWIENMYRAYGDRIAFISVNEDSDIAARDKFLEQMGSSFPMINDNNGVVMRRFKVRGLPTSLLINPFGKIVYRQEGFKLEQQNYYESILIAAVGPAANPNEPSNYQ